MRSAVIPALPQAFTSLFPPAEEAGKGLGTKDAAHLNVLRFALLDLIADFADWDNSTVPAYLETARPDPVGTRSPGRRAGHAAPDGRSVRGRRLDPAGGVTRRGRRLLQRPQPSNRAAQQGGADAGPAFSSLSCSSPGPPGRSSPSRTPPGTWRSDPGGETGGDRAMNNQQPPEPSLNLVSGHGFGLAGILDPFRHRQARCPPGVHSSANRGLGAPVSLFLGVRRKTRGSMRKPSCLR
jgi:hypothetical protein